MPTEIREFGHSGLAAYETAAQRDQAMADWSVWIAAQPASRAWAAAADYGSGYPGPPGIQALEDYDVRGSGEELVPAFTTHHSFLAEVDLDDVARPVDDYHNDAHLAFSAIGDAAGGYGPGSWVGPRFPY